MTMQSILLDSVYQIRQNREILPMDLNVSIFVTLDASRFNFLMICGALCTKTFTSFHANHVFCPLFIGLYLYSPQVDPTRPAPEWCGWHCPHQWARPVVWFVVPAQPAGYGHGYLYGQRLSRVLYLVCSRCV